MKEEIAFEGRFIEVVRKGAFEYIRMRHSSLVALTIPLTVDGEIVFIQQLRVPFDTEVIEFPAGLIGDEAGYEDESPKDAARRELIEESGYQAGMVEYLFEGPSSPGSLAERVQFFLAKDCVKIAEGGGVDHEEISVHAVPLGDAMAWLEAKASEGILVDPRARLGVLIANQNMK